MTTSKVPCKIVVFGHVAEGVGLINIFNGCSTAVEKLCARVFCVSRTLQTVGTLHRTAFSDEKAYRRCHITQIRCSYSHFTGAFSSPSGRAVGRAYYTSVSTASQHHELSAHIKRTYAPLRMSFVRSANRPKRVSEQCAGNTMRRRICSVQCISESSPKQISRTIVYCPVTGRARPSYRARLVNQTPVCAHKQT